MFNVYPVLVKYTRINAEGLLAGMPVRCSFGQPDPYAAQRLIDKLTEQSAMGPDKFCDFLIVSK